MEKNIITLVVLVLLVGLGVGYSLKGKYESSEQKVASSAHQMPDGSMMGQNIDQHFIVQMIPHHEGAIEMAKVALERSKRPEMLSLAKAIIEAQTREITDMKLWYESWFGSVLPESSMGGMHMAGMTGDLDDLKATSASEFDREFINQMIPHHEMAVVMAQMLASGTERSEMKQLAGTIITSQSGEIEMMRSWLKAWYGN